MNILHFAENFLVAELPALENGARLILSKMGEDVRLHQLVPGQAATSTALPMAIIDAIYSAVHTPAQ